MKSLLDLAGVAERAAREAGVLLRARPMRVEHKGALDLVTEVDLASERCIRAALEREAPGIAIQGEEGGGATTGTRWSVDPIDGTTNFVHGFPFYCVSIALIEGDEPVVGVIYDPIRGELYRAARGSGATINGARVHVSATSTVADALAITGFPYDRRERLRFYLGYLERVLRSAQGIRRTGSAAMDLATLAAGRADFLWEFHLKPWDTSAGVVLVREAGGTVTRLDGSAWQPDAPDILASNGALHDAVIGVLGGLESEAE